ncbi:MAG: GGDEF domain-containing protein [Candidatus Xenobia bacterium]
MRPDEDKTVLNSRGDTIIRRTAPGKVAQEHHACLVIITGPDAGQSYRLGDQRFVVGRAGDAQITLPDQGVSRHHAEIRRSEDGSFVVRDLDSTNGTFVNEEMIQSRVLQNGDKIRFGPTTFVRFSFLDVQEEQLQNQLYENAVKDGLTGIHNRKVFNDRLEMEFSYSRRHDTPLSLIMFDIDHFKHINDTWGHPAGDAILIGVAQRVAAMTRTEDLFARYGGEEFVILLRLEQESARGLADRIRQAIASTPFKTSDDHHDEATPQPHASGTSLSTSRQLPIAVTVSLGVAGLIPTMTGGEELVSAADQALYRAKTGGRNRVSI